MSSTWAERIANADENLDLRQYVTIQGIANLFQEDEADVPTTFEASARPRTKLVVAFDYGETRLNLATRRVEGGSLKITLQDDDTGTLRSLFAPRTFRKSYCRANHTAGVGTLSVKGTGWAAAAGTVYVGGETITYTGKTSTTLTGCTRGAFKSEPQTHFGAAAGGEDVFAVPSSWEGRRVYVTGYLLNTDGSTSAALSAALATYRISEPPSLVGDDVWEINCVDLVEEFAAKKIGGGLRDVQIAPANQSPLTDQATALIPVQLSSDADFDQFVIGALPTFALCSMDGSVGPLIFAVASQDAIKPDVVNLDSTQQLVTGAPSVGALFVATILTTMRHVAILSMEAATMALAIITSRLGDGANGANDKLPGLDQSNFGDPSWRMGAGILAAEVDTAAFAAAAAGSSWGYIIDEEVPLSDFLFEFCLQTNTAWYVTRAGLLSVLPLARDIRASSATIDDDVIDDHEPVKVTYDESAIYPRLHIECNYNIVSKAYDYTFNAEDIVIQKRYPGNEQSLDLKSKAIVIATMPTAIPRPSVQEGDFEDQMRRIQGAEGRGRAFIAVACALQVLNAQIGSNVVLTANVPDLEGGTVVARDARLVAQRLRLDDGLVDCTFELLDELFRVAPAAIIASAASAVMTLQTTGPEAASTTPGNSFADGWSVQIWDVSAGTKVTRTILSHTGTTVTLSSAPGFTIQNGVDFMRIDKQSAGNVAVSTDGLAGGTFLYQMPDDENDGTASPITRWS